MTTTKDHAQTEAMLTADKVLRTTGKAFRLISNIILTGGFVVMTGLGGIVLLWLGDSVSDRLRSIPVKTQQWAETAPVAKPEPDYPYSPGLGDRTVESSLGSAKRAIEAQESEIRQMQSDIRRLESKARFAEIEAMYR